MEGWRDRGRDGETEAGREVHETASSPGMGREGSQLTLRLPEFFSPSPHSEKNAVPSSLGLPRRAPSPGVPCQVFDAFTRLLFLLNLLPQE